MITEAEIIRMVNRHMARLLCNLEESGCLRAYRDAVRAEMQWLRADLLAELAREKEVVLPPET